MANIQPIRFQYPPSNVLGFSVERTSIDGFLYNFTTHVFEASPSPANCIAPLTAQVAPFLGQYRATLDISDSAQFIEAVYTLGIHDLADGNQLVGQLEDGIDVPGSGPTTGTNSLILSAAEAQVNVAGFADLTAGWQAAILDGVTSALNGATRRVLPLTLHDELYQPENTRRVRLRQYPIWDVQRVATGLAIVLTVKNTNAGPALPISRAGAFLTTAGWQDGISASGVTLYTLTSGVSATIPLTFGVYPILGQLANAITAQGNGWSAVVPAGQATYACSDLNIDIGRKSAASPQTGASFWAFTRELQQYDVKGSTGVLTIHEDLYQSHRFPDRTWPASGQYGSVRTIYMAGYNTDSNLGPVTMPGRLKLAAGILAKQIMQRTPAGLFKSERTEQTSYELFPATSLLPMVADLYGPEINCRFS